MEKKTTRRIIGILVVVALVIILLPLMFNENETTAPLQTSEANPPPFPGNSDPATLAENSVPPSHIGQMINHIVSNDEQPAVEETALTEETAAPVRTETRAPAVAVKTAQAEPATETTQTETSTPAARQTLTANEDTLEGVNLQNADLMNQSNAAAVPTQVLNDANNKIAELTNSKTPDVAPAITTSPAAVTYVDTKAPESAAVITKTTTTASNNTVTTTTTVTAKKIGWLVQLGSFKNRVNAERLTNSLRAKGYKAFTIETKSNGQTRVCVGPEFKQVAANTIANKIAQEMNMQGIVMPYRPIAL